MLPSAPPRQTAGWDGSSGTRRPGRPQFSRPAADGTSRRRHAPVTAAPISGVIAQAATANHRGNLPPIARERAGVSRCGKPYDRDVDAETAARAWSDAWTRAWRALDADLLAPVYTPDDRAPVRTRSASRAIRSTTRAGRSPKRKANPRSGWAIRSSQATEPRSSGGPSWSRTARRSPSRGTSIVRFDSEGRVVEQSDYWGTADGRTPPWDGWADAGGTTQSRRLSQAKPA